MSKAVVLFCLASMVCPLVVRAQAVDPDTVRTIVVTVDGIREDWFLDWNIRMIAWGESLGTYIPDVWNVKRGITDPNHMILYGSSDPDMCANLEGYPHNPMHHELLRSQRDLAKDQTPIVSGKPHLAATVVHSSHPAYGEPFEADTILVRTQESDLCPGNLNYFQGPDSLIVRAAIEHLDSADVKWMGLNLSEFDRMTHDIGFDCCEGDTICFLAHAEQIYQTAERLIIDTLWGHIESTPTYAGKTLLVITTDHGRHDDWILEGYKNHGHGWLPDSTDCEVACNGCRDIWAIFIGPGIQSGRIANGTYWNEDIAPTVRYLMGFSNPYEIGTPIWEVLTPTDLASPRPASLVPLKAKPNPFNPSTSIEMFLPEAGAATLRIYDVAGNLVRTLVSSEAHRAGTHIVVWDGKNNKYLPVGSGLYFGRLETESYQVSTRLNLIR